MLAAKRLPLRLSAEVEYAIHSGGPVVALESNVIAHGLPRPLNLRSAREVEDAVRQRGAIPATTAVIEGQVVVGLTDEELARVATAEGVAKVSSRELGVCLAGGRIGATTVAATMAVAHEAGIRVVASAGLGGVHRGAWETMDISPDLIQLTRSQVVLVCAGAKNILDLRMTLEYLETHCVPVVGYRSTDFPAFYCVSSGLRCPVRIDDPRSIARAAGYHWGLQGTGAMVVTHPIPAEDALDAAVTEEAIQSALESARRGGVVGSGVTKALMTAVDQASNGRASAANAVVLRTTAAVAAEIAVASSTIGSSSDTAKKKERTHA